MNLFGKTFKTAFLFIFLAELFSLFGYLLPDFNKISFIFISLLVLAVSLYRLEYGVYIALAELFIGSKGYLFYFEQDGFAISLRMSLWLIVMSVWLAKIVVSWFKTKKIKISFLKSSYFPYFLALFIFIGWGVINGILRHNELNNIFFDFNNWFYFALIFPIYDVFDRRPTSLETSDVFGMEVLQIFSAAIIWLSVKTLFLLFIFSHNIQGIVYELYRWVRVSGIGEITQMAGGFSRIFFQSHIFILIGFFVFLSLLVPLIRGVKELEFIKSRDFWILLSVASCLLSVILISFSRSFWIGLIAGLLAYWLIILIKYKINFKKFVIFNSILLASLALSVALIAAIVKFPYPRPGAGFVSDLSERLVEFSGEAGVSSRWALLPKLLTEIKKAPIFGQGFGTTITYKTSDPRILKIKPNGEYTTYAFEWGWLDIWMKVGLLGLISYLALIAKIIFDGLIQNGNGKFKIIASLVVGLIVVAVVNVFSPYLNHPLGIGYLLLLISFKNGLD